MNPLVEKYGCYDPRIELPNYQLPDVSILHQQVPDYVADTFPSDDDRKLLTAAQSFSSKVFSDSDFELPIVIGEDSQGNVCVRDLTKIRHLLIAGGVGQGVSNVAHIAISSLLFKKHPSTLKFVLLDSKGIEFALYNDLGRYFFAKIDDVDDPVISNLDHCYKTVRALKREMDDRLALLQLSRSSNIQEYNAKFVQRELNPARGHRYLPYIVVVVDEFGDFASWCGGKFPVEVARVMTLAHKVGIHFVIVTQQISKDILTDDYMFIQMARIALHMQKSKDVDSFIGGEGNGNVRSYGELLFTEESEVEKLQSPYISTADMNAICDFIALQQGFHNCYMLPDPDFDTANNSHYVNLSKGYRDPLFEEVARTVVEECSVSISMIQRKFGIGFNRTGRILDQMECAGIIGPANRRNERDVYIVTINDLNDCINNLN